MGCGASKPEPVPPQPDPAVSSTAPSAAKPEVTKDESSPPPAPEAEPAPHDTGAVAREESVKKQDEADAPALSQVGSPPAVSSSGAAVEVEEGGVGTPPQPSSDGQAAQQDKEEDRGEEKGEGEPAAAEQEAPPEKPPTPPADPIAPLVSNKPYDPFADEDEPEEPIDPNSRKSCLGVNPAAKWLEANRFAKHVDYLCCQMGISQVIELIQLSDQEVKASGLKSSWADLKKKVEKERPAPFDMPAGDEQQVALLTMPLRETLNVNGACLGWLTNQLKESKSIESSVDLASLTSLTEDDWRGLGLTKFEIGRMQILVGCLDEAKFISGVLELGKQRMPPDEQKRKKIIARSNAATWMSQNSMPARAIKYLCFGLGICQVGELSQLTAEEKQAASLTEEQTAKLTTDLERAGVKGLSINARLAGLDLTPALSSADLWLWWCGDALRQQGIQTGHELAKASGLPNNFWEDNKLSRFEKARLLEAAAVMHKALALTTVMRSSQRQVSYEVINIHNSKVAGLAIVPADDELVSTCGDKTLMMCAVSNGARTCTLNGHTDVVNCVVITPDGRHAISGSDDKSIRVWSLEGPTRGQCTASAAHHTDYVVSLATNGTLLASGARDDCIWLWDLAPGKKGSNALQLKPRGQAIRGHSDVVWALAMTRDGKHLISASADNTIKIWSVAPQPQLVRTLEGHTDAVHCLALTPNENMLISGSCDRTLRVWELATGKHLATLEGHTNEVRCVIVTHDGGIAISGSLDGSMRLWDLATVRNDGSLIQVTKVQTGLALESGQGALCSLLLSNDGRTIMSGGKDGTVKKWRPG